LSRLTSLTASSAVVGIATGVHTGSAAQGSASRTYTGPARADLPGWACVATRATVLGIGLRVDAGAVTVDIASGTGDAADASSTGGLPVSRNWTRVTTRSAVLRIAAQVDAGAIAVGGAAWTGTRSI